MKAPLSLGLLAMNKYALFLGDRTYSSWSLRGWLLFEKFGIQVANTTFVDFSLEAPVSEQMVDCKISKTVPTLFIDGGGTEISDSLAMAEELASRHPKAGIWPSDPNARAIARTLAAEMHSSFMDLRSECPMNLKVAYKAAPVSDGVGKDLRRLETLCGLCAFFDYRCVQ
jgi:glutathione S-transferase